MGQEAAAVGGGWQTGLDKQNYPETLAWGLAPTEPALRSRGGRITVNWRPACAI